MSRAHDDAVPRHLAMRQRLEFSDHDLLAECELHTYRASGPGGQKRNKTSSAVRLQHHPSGLTAMAEESRSQHENKDRALWRLREAIAIQFRAAPPQPFAWPPSIHIAEGRLSVNSRNPAVHLALALVLDVLADCGGEVSGAAARLGVSSSSVKRFLLDHPKAWVEANRMRASRGLGPLKP